MCAWFLDGISDVYMLCVVWEQHVYMGMYMYVNVYILWIKYVQIHMESVYMEDACEISRSHF